MTLESITPDMLVWAYARGIFPMARGRGSDQVDWFCPDPRAILPLDHFHVPHGLRRVLRRNPFHLTCDQAFAQVIHNCSLPRDYQPETWINPAIEKAYIELHQRGLAHSVEAWLPASDAPAAAAVATDAPPALPSQRPGATTSRPPAKAGKEQSVAAGAEAAQIIGPNGKPWLLAGGLYGVCLQGAFFGESMFSLCRDASKVCLVHLVEHLQQRGFLLLDTQFHNSHLQQFGMLEVPRTSYLTLLEEALAATAQF